MWAIDADPVGAVMALTLVAVVGAVPGALGVLWAYRRAVLRAMSRTSRTGIAPPPLAPPTHPPPPLRLDRVGAGTGAAGTEAFRAVVRRPWQIAAAYAVAGLAHAAVAFPVVWASLQSVPNVRNVSVLAVVLAWPIVPTVMTVAVAGRRWKALSAGAYLAVLGLVAGPYLAEAVVLLGVYGAVPAVALVLLGNRWLRAAGPFVAVLILAAAAGGVVSLDVLLALSGGAAGLDADTAWRVALGVTALGLGVGLWAVRVLARRYSGGRWSDQMLLVTGWWLLYTLWLGLLVGGAVGVGGLWVAGAIVAFLGVLRLALRPLARRAERERPRQLLLLRVFGSRGRSERLFHEIGLHWRTIGGITLIGAPDLAAATLDPDELVAFLGGRLRSLFVRDEADLDRQAAATEAGPDPDGRFRVTEFLCHDDTWRAAVHRLAGTADVVLVDLRGFTAANRGIAYELRLLLSTVPAQRLVLVTDATADDDALDATLREAWAGMPDGAPARATPAPVTVYDLGAQGRSDRRGLLAHLCAASGDAAPGPDVHVEFPEERRRSVAAASGRL